MQLFSYIKLYQQAYFVNFMHLKFFLLTLNISKKYAHPVFVGDRQHGTSYFSAEHDDEQPNVL